MKLLVPAATAIMLACSPAIAQDRDPSSIPGRTFKPETSDRTPGERNPTPSSQIYQTQGGETSTRTPRLSDDARSMEDSSASQGASDGSPESSKDRGRVMAMSMDTLRTSLKDAGFKDVRIVDATYLIHARTSDGNFVIMTVNPPSVSKHQRTAEHRSGQDQMGQTNESSGAQ
jgi:hypothetical protein